MALNAHRVFTSPSNDNTYLGALTLEPPRERQLREARDACRSAIKEGLREWATIIERAALFEAEWAHAEPPALRPKFKMQGSFAYHTLNEPAYSPPQEIDLDDGVFVPVSFLMRGGAAHPVLQSAGYFRAVEALLRPVCQRNGWTLVTDKPSCIRVEIDSDAHLDFALYAIPDDEFDKLITEEAALAKTLGYQHRAMVTDAAEFAEPVYRNLSADQIMLAHREEGWKPSDPRKLEDWFRKAVGDHGEQLRRVCRYLKGWRDEHWDACRLSSIALMACAVEVYRSEGAALSAGRDDLAMLQVAGRLPDLLAGRIANPVVDGQFLDEGWTADQRQEFVYKAGLLHSRLRDALEGTDSAVACLAALTAAFGARIPNDSSLIRPEGSSPAAPAVLTSGLLRQGVAEPQSAVKRDGDRRYG